MTMPHRPADPTRDRAAACQSLTVPCRIGRDTLRRRLADLAARTPRLSGTRLWEVTTRPGEHDIRVGREARRPLVDGVALRVVLVDDSCDTAVLVLVADRGWDATTLFGVAEHLTGVGEAPHFQPVTALQDSPATPPPWGIGTGEGAIELPVALPDVDDSTLGAAVTLTVDRYRGVDAEIDEDQTIAELLADIDPTGEVDTGEVRLLRTTPPGGGSYRPALAPIAPLTVCVPRGTGAGHCLVDTAVVDVEVAQGFLDRVAVAAIALATAPAGDPVHTIPLSTVECAVPDDGPAASSGSIDTRFADLARRDPHAVAVTDGDHGVSYAELDRLADVRARGLLAHGVTPGDLVGVRMDRCADLIVTLLAILKAGCGYLPMDLRHPAERASYLVEDTGARVVITSGEFPDVDGLRVLTPSEVDAKTDPDLRPPGGTADGCAYVIYTSGSTGRPKGVAVPHRNVLSLLAATEVDFALTGDDVWTMFHSAAFDFSVWEIWGCLLTGGRLVVVTDPVARATDEFHALLDSERVTVLSQTPSAFSQLIEVDRRSLARLALRLVVFGGESLDTAMLPAWFARHSHSRCRLVNMYGITETTVHVTAHDVTPSSALRTPRHIGHPLPGWRVSIRDGRGRLLPPGPAGEIWVAGAGVADGYVGRPELTAERFVVEPGTGERWYRSGDLGRLRPDGGLDHLGRIDNQVQIRGYRIELDEIRSVLVADPRVSAAAVVARGDGVEARIDAYVVGDGDVAAVMDRCRRTLPDYMIPSTVTFMDAIPLTVNGKTDTGRLPEPGFNAVPPSTVRSEDAITVDILSLWSRQLGGEVTVADNFFEKGGNSLLVIRMLNELRDRGYPRIATVDFYRNSGAAQFIELVRRLSEEQEST